MRSTFDQSVPCLWKRRMSEVSVLATVSTWDRRRAGKNRARAWRHSAHEAGAAVDGRQFF